MFLNFVQPALPNLGVELDTIKGDKPIQLWITPGTKHWKMLMYLSIHTGQTPQDLLRALIAYGFNSYVLHTKAEERARNG